MEQRPPREEKILSSLGKKNGQTFEEIFRSEKMGRESLMLGIAKLIEENLIYRDEKTKRYYIRIDIKNKILLAPQKPKHNIMNVDLELAMNELRENEAPFELGYALLRSAMFYLSKLTLEQYSPKLTNIEKHECSRLIKRCNDTIEQTFNILEKIDHEQTMAIKYALDNAITIPGYEKHLAKNATNRQQRRANKIAGKIVREVF